MEYLTRWQLRCSNATKKRKECIFLLTYVHVPPFESKLYFENNSVERFVWNGALLFHRRSPRSYKRNP